MEFTFVKLPQLFLPLIAMENGQFNICHSTFVYHRQPHLTSKT
jgi:hypothetical protein